MSDAIDVVRLTADQAGESRFDSYEMPLSLQEFAPPARPLFVSAVEPATGYVRIRLPVGWMGEAHPSPRRQILFCLSGSMSVTSSTGEMRTIAAGDAWLMGDTTGKGHRTEVVVGPVEAVIIQLSDAG